MAWNVGHDDWDNEFHAMQTWIRKTFEPNIDFGAKSCEMIAKDLCIKLEDAGHRIPNWIEVWEDHEVGARVEFNPKVAIV